MRDILKVENLSKKYFKDPDAEVLNGFIDICRAIRNAPPIKKLRKNEFWAVEDVNLTLKEGETLGLVGTNGSGKSTTLKMLANLITPTTGTIHRLGSIQALINLGAGFNPELSGRDNIRVAATLFGVKREQIKGLTDQVVEFSELKEYIDRPIKTYSSGMYARLGFSVAINLHPKVLLIDEILAVGDHNFQNKCRIQMERLKKTGVSIVLVSHNDTHIVQLCQNALWLQKGKSISYGPSKQVVEEYNSYLDSLVINKPKKEAEPGSNLYGPTYPVSYPVKDMVFVTSKESPNTPSEVVELEVGDDIEMNFEFWTEDYLKNLNVTVNIYRIDGLLITAISSLSSMGAKPIVPGKVKGRIKIESLPIAAGEYVVVMPVHEGQSYLFRGIVKRLHIKNKFRLNKGIVSPVYTYEIFQH